MSVKTDQMKLDYLFVYIFMGTILRNYKSFIIHLFIYLFIFVMG